MVKSEIRNSGDGNSFGGWIDNNECNFAQVGFEVAVGYSSRGAV